MTDFASIIRQSLQHRGATSPDERERIYAHARALMIRKLWSIQPPLSSEEIDNNIRRFNAAVDQVEREQATGRRAVETAPRYNWTAEDGKPVRRPAPPRPAVAPREPGGKAPRGGEPPRGPQGRRRDAPPPEPAQERERARRAPEPAMAAAAAEPRVRGPSRTEPHDRWRDPQTDAYGRAEPRLGAPALRGNQPYIDDAPAGLGPRRDFDDLEDFAEGPAGRAPRRRRSTVGRLFAIGLTGLAATVGLWCVIVLYPILFPSNDAGQVDAGPPQSAVAEETLRPIPPARQVLAPPGEGGVVTVPAAASAQAAQPSTQIVAGRPQQAAAPAPNIDTQSQESFIVFDGRDPTVFDAVSDNPIQFNGDIQGGFARITSTAGSAGVRAIIGPGLAQKLAGRRVRVVVVARSSILGGAGSVRIAYESGSTLSPWKNVRIAPDYEPIELIWEVPVNRNARANDYVLIEPGLPGDGSSADIRWIRIETLPS